MDINGLTEEQKEGFERFWSVELEKVGRGLAKIADGSIMNRMKQVFVAKWQMLEYLVKK